MKSKSTEKLSAEQAEWRPVVGWEMLYEVSDDGRVRSLNRVVTQRNNGGSVYSREYSGKELVPFYSRRYKAVQLAADGAACTQLIHKLVAAAFLGPRPAGLQVCHNDGDSNRNFRLNLRYGTPQDNSDDRVKHGRSRKGSESHLAKLSQSDVDAIRSVGDMYTRRQLAMAFDITATNVGAILTKKTWRVDEVR